MRTRSQRQQTWAEAVSGGNWTDYSSSEESETPPPKKGVYWRTGGVGLEMPADTNTEGLGRSSRAKLIGRKLTMTWKRPSLDLKTLED